eukprot:NODE_348_length_8996_cov_0.416433.p6 type:complete len:145 gc:universal NODE_348_length_8996_cov_0.416433:7569-7135(-)
MQSNETPQGDASWKFRRRKSNERDISSNDKPIKQKLRKPKSNKFHASPVITTSGIPQGCPISPTLFCFCLVAIYNFCVDGTWILCYADDICTRENGLAEPTLAELVPVPGNLNPSHKSTEPGTLNKLFFKTPLYNTEFPLYYNQ